MRGKNEKIRKTYEARGTQTQIASNKFWMTEIKIE